MIPALRFYGLLLLWSAIATGLTVFSGSVQLGVLLALLGDGVLLITARLDAMGARSRRITIARATIPRLSIGRDNPIHLNVQARQSPARVQIRDTYPPQFPVSTPQFDLALMPQQQQELLYTIQPDERGEAPWQAIHLRQLGPLGLAWHSWQVPAAQTAVVYPDLIGLRSLSIRLALQNTGTLRQARTFGQGTEFSELREYSTGDDLRLIHWYATARRSLPMVRVLEPEREQTLIILLDQGRLMTAQVEGLQRFDWGLNAALSLAMAGLHRGDRVGVGVFDKTLNYWLPPERQAAQFNRILDTLAPLQPNLQEPDYFGAVNQIVQQQSRRALVVMLTDVVDRTASSELLTALTRLRPRYLPFCVTLRDPQVDAIAHQQTIEGAIAPAFSQAVALDLLQQRQNTFALLKQQGVLVLDAPASRLSDELVEQYLRLKARERL